jgi:hypothetical protein
MLKEPFPLLVREKEIFPAGSENHLLESKGRVLFIILMVAEEEEMDAIDPRNKPSPIVFLAHMGGLDVVTPAKSFILLLDVPD